MASAPAPIPAGEGPLYLLGLSSNCLPEKNIPLLLEGLLAEFGELLISRIHSTEPFGVVGARKYHNAVVLLRSECSREELKSWCRALEDRLGRDRSSAQRRTVVSADLDILACCQQADELEQLTLNDEPYYLPLVAELIALAQGRADALAPAQTAEVMLAGGRIGAQPVALVSS